MRMKHDENRRVNDALNYAANQVEVLLNDPDILPVEYKLYTGLLGSIWDVTNNLSAKIIIERRQSRDTYNDINSTRKYSKRKRF
jgi:hypothetical protein